MADEETRADDAKRGSCSSHMVQRISMHMVSKATLSSVCWCSQVYKSVSVERMVVSCKRAFRNQAGNVLPLLLLFETSGSGFTSPPPALRVHPNDSIALSAIRCLLTVPHDFSPPRGFLAVIFRPLPDAMAYQHPGSYANP